MNSWPLGERKIGPPLWAFLSSELIVFAFVEMFTVFIVAGDSLHLVAAAGFFNLVFVVPTPDYLQSHVEDFASVVPAGNSTAAVEVGINVEVLNTVFPYGWG